MTGAEAAGVVAAQVVQALAVQVEVLPRQGRSLRKLEDMEVVLQIRLSLLATWHRHGMAEVLEVLEVPEAPVVLVVV